MREQPSDRGFVSDEVQWIRDERRYRLTMFMMGVGAPILLGFASHDLFHGRLLEASLSFCVGILFTVSFFILRKRRSLAIVLLLSRVFLFLLGILLLYLVLLTHPRDGNILWCYLYPLIAYFMFGKREGTGWMLSFFVLAIGLLMIPSAHLDPNGHHSFKLRFLASFGVVGVLSYVFVKVYEQTNQQLHQQHLQRRASERRYREAYETLKQTQAQLIQTGKLASLGELVAGVAHELNQPLMVIRTNAQMLKRLTRKGDLGTENLLEIVGYIRRSTTRMMRIIQHLSIFSRQSRPQFSPTDVHRPIMGCFFMLGKQLKVHSIEVKIDVPPDLPKVMGDENELEQVFLNLLSNARDAILAKRRGEAAEGDVPGAGPGKIWIRARQVRGNGESIEILIRDSGIGISSKELKQVFDPFFTTKEVGKGTGLGLSISYGIIQTHGGDIRVARTSGAGTTFVIRLPALSQL